MLAFLSQANFSYFSPLTAAGLFVALAVPVLLLGYWSLAGLGAARKWVAIGVRLLVLLLIVLILGGLTWSRRATDVHVMVLEDVSDSTRQVREYPDRTLNESVDAYLKALSRPGDDSDKRAGDRIGVISFADRAYVDSVAEQNIRFDARSVHEGGRGTDAASAIQLGLATLGRDSLHRMLLLWDGNQTTGDLESAVNAAVAANVPIDVMPLRYDVTNEVMVDRFVAPTWKRENEPFTIEVHLTSTNATPTGGRLTVTHQGLPMDLDAATPGVQQTRKVTLQPGKNVERISVPPLPDAGVHQFRASFAADDASADGGVTIAGQNNVAGGSGSTATGPTGGTPGGTPGDTMAENNIASTFTFVRGKGRVLYIDNVAAGRGDILRKALARQGIETDTARTRVDQFPVNALELQNYDAVILANVPRGPGGITDDQSKALAAYVHDMGGGLVMIGGDQALGAGGWQGTRLEEILPLNMDVPAQRQIPKGGLVLVMHSCEFPDGNYWGMQCGMKAVEVLNARDEVGVVSFGGSGSVWDYPLSSKEDGSKVNAALKNMALGDMPSFDDSLKLALNGGGGSSGLIQSDARNKHIIIISDGDPQAPAANLISAAVAAQISISTVAVYPHNTMATMQAIAKQTGGRSYGPITGNFSQLPQIFVKEASIVRRSLISEDSNGIPVKLARPGSEVLKGLDESIPTKVVGLILSSVKQSPLVEMPLVAGPQNDPLLAYWQTGLGRSLVFTSDAHNKWTSNWVQSTIYDKFWAQAVRQVARPAESADFDVQVSNSGGRGKIVVEAVNKDNQFRNGLTIRGSVVGPDMQPHSVTLVQTAPGTYEAEFDSPDPGNYVVGLSYTGADNQSGILRSGTVANSSPELRDLRSNEAILRQIAEKTGGRFIDTPFSTEGVALFSRDGLIQRDAPMPVWDLLLPFLIGLLLLDVAVRRIAWDPASLRKAAVGLRTYVRSFTTPRAVETTSSVDALRRVRQEATAAPSASSTNAGPVGSNRGSMKPDAGRKFEARGDVSGDISSVVGGARTQPLPKTKQANKPGGTSAPPADTTGSLLEAKRRAQKKMNEGTDQSDA